MKNMFNVVEISNLKRHQKIVFLEKFRHKFEDKVEKLNDLLFCLKTVSNSTAGLRIRWLINVVHFKVIPDKI